MIKHLLTTTILAAATLPAQANHPEAAAVGHAILKQPACFTWGKSAEDDMIAEPIDKALPYFEKIGLAKKNREVEARDYLKEGRPYRFQGNSNSPYGKVHVYVLTDEGKRLFSPEKGAICHKVAHATKVAGWTEPKEGPDGLLYTHITYEWRIEYLKPEWRAAFVEIFKKEPVLTGTTTTRLVKKNGQWIDVGLK